MIAKCKENLKIINGYIQDTQSESPKEDITEVILAIGIYITHAENVEDIKALEKYIDHYALLAEEADLSAAPQIKALHILIKTLISEYEVVIEQLESRGIKIEDILTQVGNGN